VRGTYLTVKITDRSTHTADKELAKRFLRKWKAEIEKGCFTTPNGQTFKDATINYIAATGNSRFLDKLINNICKYLIRAITQKFIDDTAITLYPTSTPATGNRQV
jgi:hypothetical protein